VDVPVVPVGIGLGLVGTAVLGRTGLLPGLPGRRVTKLIGSSNAKARVDKRVNEVLAEKLIQGGRYNPLGLEAASITRSKFYELQGRYLALEDGPDERRTAME
jgi:hypothetical protein